jgi:hypothetical protein
MNENYTIVVPFIFAVISVVVKVLSRRDDDTSPKRNDLYVGQSLMLGAMSASLAFTITAGKEYINLNDKIDERKPGVYEAKEREKQGQLTFVDTVFIKQDERDNKRAREIVTIGFNCMIIALVCTMIVLILAAFDRFVTFEKTDTGFQRKWVFWTIFNCVGLISFLWVLIYTKPQK